MTFVFCLFLLNINKIESGIVVLENLLHVSLVFRRNLLLLNLIYFKFAYELN